MSYLTKASEVVFSNSWETYPYSSSIGGAGDLHFFQKSEKIYSREISGIFVQQFYVKLNVRKKFNELYPEEFPKMHTIGYAVKELFSNLEINNYFSAEDRGWELSDYWATLEAVFVLKKDYETKILPRINGLLQKALNPNKESPHENQSWRQELECPITHEIMKDPVIGSDGHTYERSAIENWLKSNPRSPMTGEAMSIGDLRANLSIRKIIDTLKSNNS